MSQKVFKVDGSLGEESDMKPEDIAELQRWKRVTMDCPYCLLRITLDRFATFISGTKKHPRKLSRKTMKCPGCNQGMRIDTLKRCTNQTVEEFANWFWENVFLYRMMERVDGDNFFARVKLWRWEDRNIFWAVYHKYKSAKDPKHVEEDEESYAEYKRQYEAGEITFDEQEDKDQI